MFCPQCGATHSDELRFCKACGANLFAVRKAVASPESVERFDWNKTWLAEMLKSSDENVRRAAEMERLQGITPETKRRKEIKAGVIISSVGVGVMVTVFFVMQGVILGGFVPQAVAEILSRVWVAGIIPFLVGLALIVNGTIVTKKHVELPPLKTDRDTKELDTSSPDFLPPAGTNRIAGGIPFSVTDETTQHLEEPIHTERKS